MKFFNHMLESVTPNSVKKKAIKEKVRIHLNERFKLGGNLDQIIDQGTEKIIEIVGVDAILEMRNVLEKLNAYKVKEPSWINHFR